MMAEDVPLRSARGATTRRAGAGERAPARCPRATPAGFDLAETPLTFISTTSSRSFATTWAAMAPGCRSGPAARIAVPSRGSPRPTAWQPDQPDRRDNTAGHSNGDRLKDDGWRESGPARHDRVPGDLAGQAAADRGSGGRRQDRAGPPPAPAVQRGPGRDQGALRVGLRQAAPLHQILREKIGHVVADAPDLESAVDRTARRRVCSSPNGFWTSNNTRDLSAALKRRCLRLFLDYPSAGTRAGDHPLEGNRPARGAGQAAGEHRPRLRELGLRVGRSGLPVGHGGRRRGGACPTSCPSCAAASTKRCSGSAARRSTSWSATT
jgi:hypothetical protein